MCLGSATAVQGHHVLELGGGTGFVSLIARAILSDPMTVVFCTDIGENILANCARNSTANQLPLVVRSLDWRLDETWLQPTATPLTSSPLSAASYTWTSADLFELHAHPVVFLAADVIYDCDLTNAFANCIASLLGGHYNYLFLPP